MTDSRKESTTEQPGTGEAVVKSQPAEPTRPMTGKDWWARLWDEWPPPAWFPQAWRDRFADTVDAMRVEEVRDGDVLVVRVEMPGMDPDKDVQIDVTDHALQIRAQRRQESRTEEKGGYRSEFRYGSFARTLTLPPGIDESDVTASYKDGILEVRVPVDESKAKARRIEVTRS